MLQKDKSSQFEKELKEKLQKFTNKKGGRMNCPPYLHYISTFIQKRPF